MLWLQKGWIGRVLAAVLIASMLPTLVVPRARTTGGPQFGTYERWFRAQLRISGDVAVEEAIAAAVAEGTDSVREFVAVFLRSYEDAVPGRAIAQVFTERELSTDALISYLQSRYTRVVDDAVFPRSFLTTAVNQTVANGQSGASSGVIAGDRASSLIRDIAAGNAHIGALIIIPFRVLSSARSLGP
jgi:hypothetical protein